MRKSKLTGSVAALRAVGFALALLFAALSLGGCPALLVPGLAYQGYKAIHKTEPTATSPKQSSRPAADRTIE